MALSDHPKNIDRFAISQVLGRGSQGIVYLATDPDLGRQVAIKSVLSGTDMADQSSIDLLFAEARTVSKLQHPNIVTIYELGVAANHPYLVLEYVDGMPLQDKAKSHLNRKQMMIIMRDVLYGVAAAHQQNIIHCDLKPANILIDKQGHAKVADFGLAQLSGVKQGDQDALYGTPQYMAPEYIESATQQTVSDVFSIGLIFYELLTGKAAFEGEDVYQILNAIAHAEVLAPSQVNQHIDEELDRIILHALEKNPKNRYADAGEMLREFDEYMSLADTESSERDSDVTTSFLLRRMRLKKDFPIFSQTISVLNQASSSDSESLATVSNAILKDYSLTNKVLRLVNSVHYNRGGDKISTISRAVVMLGINPVRNIAAGLMLFEHMQNKLQSYQMKEDAVQSLFSALVANELALDLKINQHEEAFLCALLQHLGKVLVRFYLHEESEAIDKMITQDSVSESSAVKQVLGTSYQQLGISIAREWGFPESIIDGMKPLLQADTKTNLTSNKPLQLISHFSNALGEHVMIPFEQQEQALKLLTDQYAKPLKLNKEKVEALINNGLSELEKFTKSIQFDYAKSQFYQHIQGRNKPAPNESDSSDQVSEFADSRSAVILRENISAQNKSSDKALSDGIQDITNTLTGEFSINQVMQMILETIYRALTGCRVILCLRDAKTASIKARFGYGDGVDKILEKFVIPLAYQADVFHIAFKNNADIRIENTSHEKIKTKIPAWYTKNIAAKSFAIFPISIKQSPIALIYIDSASNQSIKITDEQLGKLKTLRNQAILAIKTSH